MPGARGIVASLCAVLLTACNGGQTTRQAEPDSVPPARPFTAEDFAKFRDASCPNPNAFITPQPVSLTATPLTPETLQGAELDDLTFAGAWHLTSDEPNFGGLSGLTVHPKDHLLGVSDSGAFVWISMLDNAPSGFGAISYMRDETGRQLSGKRDADSEGLELVDGLAFVSFERNHRIMAFDVANCGAAANGVLVTRISENPDALPLAISDNLGAEGLVLHTGNRLIAGLEMKTRNGAPIVSLSADETETWQFLDGPSDKRLVGLDEIDGTLFSLFRNYSPLTGNQIEIHAQATADPAPAKIATLKRPFPVDNFEGITATRLADGTVRLYIISDDNFSARQRTLLMAFDVTL